MADTEITDEELDAWESEAEQYRSSSAPQGRLAGFVVRLVAALRSERTQTAKLRDALKNLLDADETFRENGPAIEEWKYVAILSEAHDLLPRCPSCGLVVTRLYECEHCGNVLLPDRPVATVDANDALDDEAGRR